LSTTASVPDTGLAGAPLAAERIRVEIEERGYDIVIGAGLLGEAATYSALSANSVAVVVSNSTVAPLYAERVTSVLRSHFRAVAVVTLEDGEAHKTWPSVERIFDALLAADADRHALLFALGGGVIGDLTGFAAACYMRGISYVQLPTTLLAQVDSSVGGKTAINHPQGKNLIGAFHQPRLVVADLETLATLPQRELVAGLAEVIKIGAVADAEFFDWIDAHLDELLGRDTRALAQAVSRSCALKASIVARDERESGLRANLNFGHTFGHAIEAGLGFGAWLHGEAVGCGMVLAADLSVSLGLLDAAAAARLESLIGRAGLPLRAPRMEVGRWIDLMHNDKKAESGTTRFVLLEGIGAALVRSADPTLVSKVIERRAA
jgi:3-dehydroquinate synthase